MAPFPQVRPMAHEKHAGGRPSEYRPEYCDMVIEFMAQGYSLTAFAGSIRKSKDQIYRWIVAHSEFSNAVTRARSARVAALEAKLLRSRKGAETSAAIFALRNADPTEWRDVRNVQHDHTVRAEMLSDKQLYAIAAGKPVGDADTIEGECEEIVTR